MIDRHVAVRPVSAPNTPSSHWSAVMNRQTKPLQRRIKQKTKGASARLRETTTANPGLRSTADPSARTSPDITLVPPSISVQASCSPYDRPPDRVAPSASLIVRSQRQESHDFGHFLLTACSFWLDDLRDPPCDSYIPRLLGVLLAARLRDEHAASSLMSSATPSPRA